MSFIERRHYEFKKFVAGAVTKVLQEIMEHFSADSQTAEFEAKYKHGDASEFREITLEATYSVLDFSSNPRSLGFQFIVAEDQFHSLDIDEASGVLTLSVTSSCPSGNV